MITLDSSNEMPIWAVQLINRLDQITNRLDQITNRIDQTNNRLDQTNFKLDQTNNQLFQVRYMNSVNYNCNIRYINQQRLQDQRPIPLLKENYGIGNHPGLQTEGRFLPKNPQIGDVPGFFPEHHNDRLSNSDLTYLSRFYNNNFGIQEYDSLEQKNEKFYNWICYSTLDYDQTYYLQNHPSNI
ncbi:hypothetical protein CYY_001185 [Polysphondylium violaceum]|uniref:Uncharacterized protein n=1 Tax=Polysphondylium violaceum TaxID=133409 RepID=A0A8J4Q9N7_9MYCE|nr:hypothetical protein CYY_001185 [Polysphondylium violaceum]